MVNPLSGHTAAGNTLGQDGLRDGDVITSPSLTNALEGIHGNGILRLRDSSMARPDIVNGSEGALTVGGSPHLLTVQGGYCVLDGNLYEFAGGPGDTATITLGATAEGTGTALTATGTQQVVYVIFIAPDTKGGGTAGVAGLHYAGGTPVDVTTGIYPILPSQYLADYEAGTARNNEQVIVLAVVRCKYNAGAGTHKAEIIEINDKRVFLGTNPQYMIPLSKGGSAADSAGRQSQIRRNGGDGVNNAADLRSLHAGTEAGSLGLAISGAATQLNDVGAMWLSTAQYGTAGNTPPGAGTDGFGYGPSQGLDRAGNPTRDVLYFAGQANDEASVETTRLFTRGVEARAGSQNYGNNIWLITAECDQFFVLVPDANHIRINPSGDFPEGHTIEIRNNGGAGNIVFDSGGINETMSANQYGRFVYEGSVWVKLIKQAVL